MKIEFYKTTPITEICDHKKIFGFAFSVIPSITITECNIYLHWLFWGIEFKFN